MAHIPMQRNDLSFWEARPDPPPCPTFAGEGRADVAIVGGGFAGLSAAYHLRKECPDLRIALLEAHTIGSGASGRNTGMLSPRIGGTILHLCDRYGEESARQLYECSILAVRQVQRLIETEQLDCSLEDAPQIKVARTRSQAVRLHKEAEMLQKLGFAGSYLSATEINKIAPVNYRAGLCYPQSAQLNPVQLCREFKRILLARGVQIYEQSPVSAVKSGPTVQIQLPTGTLLANQAILATNAYTPQLGVMAGQLVPLQTHVIVTDRLTTQQREQLTWEGRHCFYEADRLFCYYRLTPDDRIMFGGGQPLYTAAAHNRWSGGTDIGDPSTWRELERGFYRRFPSLSQVAISARWSGTIAMTLDEMPTIGAVAEKPGLYFAGGWNGHGVAFATASGAGVANLIVQRSQAEPSYPWERTGAPRVPTDPLRKIGLRAYLALLKLADVIER